MNQRSADVLILGGGVIGLACAHYLLKTGRSVTVLEQGTPGCGSSHGNCGTITPSHATPLAMPGMISRALACLFNPDAPLRIAPRLDFELLGWLLQFAHRCNWRDFHRIATIKAPLLLRARELLEELITQERLACGFAATGTLCVFRDLRVFEQSRWLPQILGECGITVETLDRAHVRAIEPALNDTVIGGYLNPGDAHLRPDSYVAELARIVRAQGGEIYEHTKVASVRASNGRIGSVLTTRGEFAGRDVILALGAWSSPFARQLGLYIPVQPCKGYSITYTRPTRCPRIPLVLKERSVCVTAWDSGYRLGSTMEFAGYDSSLNRVRLEAIKRGAAEYLLEPEGGEVLEEWYGWRPMTYDDLPIIGRPRHLQNLVLATGHGMLGVTLSAVTGVLVSELLCDRLPSLDMLPFSPARFGL